MSPSLLLHLFIAVLICNVCESYHVSSNQYTMAEANNYCATECDSTLATIHSDSDQNNVIKTMPNSNQEYLWIGLIYNNSNHDWIWIDSTVLDYVYDTSLSYIAGQNCVVIDTNSYLWISANCSDSYQCVCNSCTTDNDTTLFHPAVVVILFVLVIIVIIILSMIATKIQRKRHRERAQVQHSIFLSNTSDSKRDKKKPHKIHRIPTKRIVVDNVTDIDMNIKLKHGLNANSVTVSSLNSNEARSLEDILDGVIVEIDEQKTIEKEIEMENKMENIDNEPVKIVQTKSEEDTLDDIYDDIVNEIMNNDDQKQRENDEKYKVNDSDSDSDSEVP